MTIYFISENENKYKEINSILGNVKMLKMNLPEIQSFNPQEIIEEKLKIARKIYPYLEVIVEDTSLYLDALGGFPGPFIKYFLKQNSLEDIYEIAKSREEFKAFGKTLIGYKDLSGNHEIFEGTVKGKIVKPIVGSDFGWDPIFQPEGYFIPFGEMSPHIKNEISMRGIATKKLKYFLDNNH